MRNISKISILLFFVFVAIGKVQGQGIYDIPDNMVLSNNPIKIKFDKRKLKTKEARLAWNAYEFSYQRRSNLIPELIVTVENTHPLNQEIIEDMSRLREETVLSELDELTPENI